MTKGKAIRPETIAAAYGVASDTAFASVVPPLYLSSTYEFTGYAMIMVAPETRHVTFLQALWRLSRAVQAQS
jgi:cystathionine beta-lyase/cystathionine gamma-synthase